MLKKSFTVDHRICMDCSLALRRFLGGLEGVESIETEQGKIVISFNEQELPEEKLASIAKDSIRKLGYDVEE